MKGMGIGMKIFAMNRTALGRVPAFAAALVWLAAFCWPVHALATAAVGEVIFVSGTASAEVGGDHRALAVGDTVQVGERLVTAADSHLHVRLVDGALISVRPDSIARVSVYDFDGSNAADSRVRIELEQGALRSATGEAGKHNRSGFRINTPVAAIGIRGTDFAVFADEQLARLMVHSGGVVMAPLGAECVPTAFGPCEHGAVELFASVGRALLEVRAGEAQAQITSEGPGPDELRPPHPAEERFFEASGENTQRAVQRRNGLSAPGAESYEDGLERVERYLQESALEGDEASLVELAYQLGEQGGGVILPRDRQLVNDPQVIWGRWSGVRTAAYREELGRLYEGRRYVLLNSVFAMLEYPHEERPLPEVGRVSFDLNSYEAYIKRGARLEEAAISNAALLVDFEQGSFATRLDVHAGSLPGAVQVVGAGELTANGFFYSDANSPARIEGVLAPHAGEAGMLFEYQVSPGVEAVGATHWVNDGR